MCSSLKLLDFFIKKLEHLSNNARLFRKTFFAFVLKWNTLREMSRARSRDFTGDSFVLHVTSRAEFQLTKNKDASPKLAIISSLRNGKDATLMYKAFSNSRDFYSRSERK